MPNGARCPYLFNKGGAVSTHVTRVSYREIWGWHEDGPTSHWDI